MPKRTCSIEGCDNSLKWGARGMCSKHYQRWRAHGDPNIVLMLDDGTPLLWLRERFDADDTDECIFMPGKRTRKTVELEGRTTGAHIVVCTWQNGPRPGSMDASHLCGNGHLGCVNRRHLIWETHADNLRRRDNHGTLLRGENHPSTRLSETEVRQIRADNRTHREIAADYGISRQHVTSIRNRKDWSWLV